MDHHLVSYNKSKQSLDQINLSANQVDISLSSLILRITCRPLSGKKENTCRLLLYFFFNFIITFFKFNF